MVIIENAGYKMILQHLSRLLRFERQIVLACLDLQTAALTYLKSLTTHTIIVWIASRHKFANSGIGVKRQT